MVTLAKDRAREATCIISSEIFSDNVKQIAIGAAGLGYDSWATQIDTVTPFTCPILVGLGSTSPGSSFCIIISFLTS